MFNFTVDEGKDGSVIDIDVHFQAYATIASPDAGISVGPITNIVSATKINLYLKDSSNNIIMETSDINPNDYVGTIRLKSTVNAGTYIIYAAGATLTTNQSYNNHGWTGLLLSRAGIGTKNSVYTLTQKSIADYRTPVYKTIDTGGSQTTAGTYLSEIIPKGISNCPGVNCEITAFRANLFRIF